jgi:hypothetical protein
VAYDPCGLIPDPSIPAGKALQSHSHAIHHVIGRIRHRARPRIPHHAKAGHAEINVNGCERQATGSATYGQGDGSSKLLRTVSTGPALAAISGAGGAAIGGLGGYVTGRATSQHRNHGSHKDSTTPVPEPSSILIFLSAALICLAARTILSRSGCAKRSAST